MNCTAPAETTKCMTTTDYLEVVKEITEVLTELGDHGCTAQDCKQADWAGCVLRMAGHDFMDFADGFGGSDGCTNMLEPDNAGLDPCLASGEFGFSLKDIYLKFCGQISLADFVVIAGEAVMTFTRKAAVTHALEQDQMDPSSSTANLNFSKHFRWGRTTLADAVCKQSFEMILPNPEKGCSEVERVFVDNLGLSWSGSVALMGVNSRLFNNNYYKSILTKGWKPKKMSENQTLWIR